MTTLLATLLALCNVGFVPPQEPVRVYFGTAGPTGEGIYLATLDNADGTLSQPRLAAEVRNAGFVALHPSGRYLYATTTLPGDARPNGGVAAFRIQEDGSLAFLDRQPSEGRGPCHVSVDPSGRCLLVANYGSGSVAALAIAADGSLRASTSAHAHQGSSVHPRRQRGPHAHSIYPGPDNAHAYAADLGTDEIAIYRLDCDRAQLAAAGSAAVPPGSGPRHLKFSRDGRHAYVLNEMGLTISVFARDPASGGLSLTETIPVLPEGAERRQMSCSEIRVHPNGRIVYTANRDLAGEDRDSLSVFEVRSGGKLARVQTTPAEVWIPRNFTLDPTGRWLLVAGQRANEIAVFAVDAERGTLRFTGQKVAVPAPMCVVFATPGSGDNLAIVARPTASHVSGDTSLRALCDGHEPRSSRDRRRGSYGNWPRRGTQWVQYEWSRPIHTNRIDVYWWDDRRGVRLPAACRLLYWNGDGFVPVGHPSGLGVAGDRFNTTTFDEVRASKLRLEIDGAGRDSTGILEWRVYDSGTSPDFPPLVDAGVDRAVVLGGKTYLAGEVRSVHARPASEVVWRKASGPGTVTFEDAGAATTTATFFEPGDYVLELTASRGSLRSSATLAVQAVPPPATPLAPVATRRYRLQSPLWNDRIKAVIVHWIPHCIRKIEDPDLREGGLNNFDEAAKKLAGEPHGRHRGYVFANAWVYNTIEAMALARMVEAGGDAEIQAAQEAMQAALERWIPRVLAAQEPDGYIQTAFTLSDRPRWSPRRRGDHEGYVAGYFLEAAIAHSRMSDGADTRLYDAAKRLADCWYDHIGPAPKQEWYDGHQAMEMALVRFGRYVGEVEGDRKGAKYLALAKFLLDCRKGGTRYDQSHVPVIRQYEAVGHAVRAVYSYAAMADVARETGDLDYLSAVQSLWNSIVHRKYYVTGGVGSGETSEGFGPDYSLRQNAYCESCSSCGEIFFQHGLGLLHRDGTYADLCEETLYNALLGSLDLAGENFYYQNPLDSRRPRYDWHVCPCCVGNIPRTLLMLPTWMYAKGRDSVHVNLFVGSTVQISGVAGTDVEMVQATDYPWKGAVRITVNPAQEAAFAVKIRLPNRSVSDLYRSTPAADGVASIAVNGTAVQPPSERGYAVIRRRWRKGDTIDLELPLRVQRIHASERVRATHGRVALRYGPLLYNVEQVDQDITQVLPPDAPLEAAWNADLLGGVVVIRGTWADGSPLTAVPNYARNNRGPAGERRRRRRGPPSSIVWIRDR